MLFTISKRCDDNAAGLLSQSIAWKVPGWHWDYNIGVIAARRRRCASNNFTSRICALTIDYLRWLDMTESTLHSKEGSVDTILVVEDSRPMQRTLQRLFEADGLRVQIASDGIAGLESFRKHTPNVGVLDLKLPRLPGKEVCRAFKAHAAGVPIVVLSANCEVEEKVWLRELGSDDCVTKPFSPRERLARVRRAMRRGLPTAAEEAPGGAARAPATPQRVGFWGTKN